MSLHLIGAIIFWLIIAGVAGTMSLRQRHRRDQ
jgi:hypothetical protein